MYEVSITVGDYDFDDPEEAARAMLNWLRIDRTTVFVNVTDETGKSTMVEVQAPMSITTDAGGGTDA